MSSFSTRKVVVVLYVLWLLSALWIGVSLISPERSVIPHDEIAALSSSAALPLAHRAKTRAITLLWPTSCGARQIPQDMGFEVILDLAAPCDARGALEHRSAAATAREEEEQATAAVGSLAIVLLPGPAPAVLFGPKRTVAVTLAHFSRENVANAIAQVQQQTRGQDDSKKPAAKTAKSAATSSSSSSSSSSSPSSSSKKTMILGGKWRLSFSLVVADPVNDRLHWDFWRHANTTLRALQKQLEPYSTISFDSRVVPYGKSLVKFKRHDDGKHSFINEDVLNNFIDFDEWDLKPNVIDYEERSLHFVAYVPPAAHRPLLIAPTSKSAFVVPEWGGVVFVDDNILASPVPAHVLLRRFMHQFRELIGVPPLAPGIDFVPAPSGLADWELDALIDANLAALMQDTVRKIQSLSNLFQKMHNLIIKDSIRVTVEEIVNGYTALQRNPPEMTQLFTQVSHFARLASRLESHPSLLTTLYFPDEHKAAIYLPLALPLIVPIIKAALRIIKNRKPQAE